MGCSGVRRGQLSPPDGRPAPILQVGLPWLPMKCLRLSAALVTLVWTAAPAEAHPAPFSFVDVRLESTAVDVRVVLHVFDVAHELDIEASERLLDSSTLAEHQARLVELIGERLQIGVDGLLLPLTWSTARPLPARQAVELTARLDPGRASGVIRVAADLFPYDANHQTFLNFYEGEALISQAILDDSQAAHEYFVGTPHGVLAVAGRFVPAGIHHILIGPDHLLFVVGLLLFGGSLRRLLLVVTGFTLAHSLTLTLAVLGVVAPPGRVVEAVIALSIVYVGVDNLMSRGGRDVRVAIAVVFGFIHGFGFASVLRDMGLPREALGWSLFSFNLGVEVGQLAVVVVVTSALAALRAHSHMAALSLAYVGSVVVIAAGVFWFVERVFLSGGVA